jgi:hypothetical protein
VENLKSSPHMHIPLLPMRTPKKKKSVGFNIDLPTSESVKKFTYASLFIDTLAHLKISKKTFGRHIYMVVVRCCLFFKKNKKSSLVSRVRSNLITKKISTEYIFIHVMLISILGAPIVN